MLIDSHCHLNLIDLTEFNGNLINVINKAQENDVQHFLCVSVDLSDYETLYELAETYSNVSISVGLHPNNNPLSEPSCEQLVQLAQYNGCIAIGETGLDYFRIEHSQQKIIQQQRFRTHIQAAKKIAKPLIIHTRHAAEDTLRLMQEESANIVGGVMHCFTESWAVAKKALDMNFYISLSGIVTFKNATNLHDIAKKIPCDRLLIETDAPYLAPVPFRGKQNHPALVKYVALALSELRKTPVAEIAKQTTENFYRCFHL